VQRYGLLPERLLICADFTPYGFPFWWNNHHFRSRSGVQREVRTSLLDSERNRLDFIGQAHKQPQTEASDRKHQTNHLGFKMIGLAFFTKSVTWIGLKPSESGNVRTKLRLLHRQDQESQWGTRANRYTRSAREPGLERARGM
jgi:hypothetical protein